jgi:recombination protein RecA
LGVAAGVMQKSGAWYSFGDERLGQGRENVRVFLKENPDLYEKITGLVFDHYGIRRRKNGTAAPAAERAEAAGDGGKPDAVLANAPDREGAYFGVPKVVE